MDLKGLERDNFIKKHIFLLSHDFIRIRAGLTGANTMKKKLLGNITFNSTYQRTHLPALSVSYKELILVTNLTMENQP